MKDNNGKEVSEIGQDLLKSIGNIFKDFRTEHGLTQKEAAKAFGGSQASVSDLENGKTDIHIITLQRWADFYGYELELSCISRTDVTEDDVIQAALELEEELRG